ncbi:MAG: glycosyl transferase [Boseongicola sp.]|nr:glycosyl transferase [Boseongicola sp.]
MSVGFVMMAHAALYRAGQVARHLADHGATVVIHVDKRTPKAEFFQLVQDVSDLGNVHFAPRLKCDWGTWSLVEASRQSAKQLLELDPSVNHVCLVSGACLPIRPVPALQQYLSDFPDTDFIESVTIREVPWTQGGLSEERFTLTFPFAWKRQKRLFDAWVDVQRRFGRKRKIPSDLGPHMGSQWWCLTRRTLEAILNDPERKRIDSFFRRVWIPDESYYATLVRRHSDSIESRSLTLSKFDFQGKPHVFYDDHLMLLRQSSAFFARKIWPGARRLYGAFLGPVQQGRPKRRTPAYEIDKTFSDAVSRRTRGRAGLLMASRFPAEGFENGLTAAPYAVFHGFGDLFEDFPAWVEKNIGSRAHGHLFAPERVEFSYNLQGFAGGLSDSPSLRDYNPGAFLTNLIWNTRGEHQSFLYSPRDHQGISDFLARDPNALIASVSGAWALPLFRSGKDICELRTIAAELQKRETMHLNRLQERRTRARVRIWTLAEFLEDPDKLLQTILDDITLTGAQEFAERPKLKPIRGLAVFLQELRNAGMNPHTAGALSERRAEHNPDSSKQVIRTRGLL